MDKEYQEIYRSRRQRLLDVVDGVVLIFANVETVRNNDVFHSFRQDSDFSIQVSMNPTQRCF